ncbi:hypothetical protein [Bradyrhizobium sp. STM 3566]|uniref:hypothetical protein n=1 Tax=Bradyrhizobium sp. STM 3566 TaxID=578928 RepID=UPI00388EC269
MSIAIPNVGDRLHYSMSPFADSRYVAIRQHSNLSSIADICGREVMVFSNDEENNPALTSNAVPRCGKFPACSVPLARM